MFPFCSKQIAIKGTELSTPISDGLERSRLLLSADLVKPPRSCQDTAVVCPSPTQRSRNTRGSRQLPKKRGAVSPPPPPLRAASFCFTSCISVPALGQEACLSAAQPPPSWPRRGNSSASFTPGPSHRQLLGCDQTSPCLCSLPAPSRELLKW